MNGLKIHIVYEYGIDLRPHASSFVRLLRPLTHPTVRRRLEATTGMDYNGQKADAVIVDRLWRPDVSGSLARGLVDRVKNAGARLVYSLDDNLLDLPLERKDWPREEHLWVLELFLRQADVVVVTTPALRNRVLPYNVSTVVIPNALDERLLVGRAPDPVKSSVRSRRKVIGFMGTSTHDADLLAVLPALRALTRRYPGDFEFQIVGGIGQPGTFEALREVPFRLVSPRPEEVEYPLFMLWFSSQLSWDLAISPLRNTPFGRCKSDIKFLDYSAIGAAGVYSRGPVYGESVRHQETGWLTGDDPAAWEDALERLLRDDERREQVARAATEYLWSERILAKSTHQWLEMLDAACPG